MASHEAKFDFREYRLGSYTFRGYFDVLAKIAEIKLDIAINATHSGKLQQRFERPEMAASMRYLAGADLVVVTQENKLIQNPCCSCSAPFQTGVLRTLGRL